MMQIAANIRSTHEALTMERRPAIFEVSSCTDSLRSSSEIVTAMTTNTMKA